MTSDDIQIVQLPLEEPAQGRWRRLTLLIGITLLVSAPGCMFLVQDQESRRSAGDIFWRVEGEPCAPLGADRFRGVQRSPSVTNYDGVVFERHGGAMICTHRTERVEGAEVRYPVCKFTSPDYLAVSAAGQERFYDMTMGRSAAVGVVNGNVRCVVAPKFDM